MDEDLLPKDKHLMTYGTSTLSPRIDLPDTDGFKRHTADKVKKVFTKKLEELKQEFDDTMKKVELNKLVLSAEIRFEPKTGMHYYLYKRDDDTNFLSMIQPNEWTNGGGWDGPTYLGTFAINSDGVWELIQAPLEKGEDV